MNTAKILAKGSALRIVYFFINAIFSLFLMPFIVHSLGDRVYGLWIFIGTFLGYYWLFDMGLGSAVQRYVSRAIGKGDHIEANTVINSAFLLFSIMGCMALFVSCVVAFYGPVLIKNIGHDANLFRNVIIVMGLSFAIGLPMRIFSGILISHIRYDLQTFINVFVLIFRTILIVIFLRLGFGVLALAYITFISDLVGYILNYICAKKTAGYLILNKNFIDIEKIKTLFKFSSFVFVTQIADQLRFNIDNLVITAFRGLNLVTLYSIASRLVIYFIGFTWNATGFMMPIFSRYDGENDYVSIREKFILMTKISGYLSIFVGANLIFFGRVFIERWMGSSYLAAYPILIILVVPVIFDLILVPSVSVFYGISKHKALAMMNIFEGVFNLLLSLLLVKRFGLIGVAIGTAIPMLIVKVIIQPIYACKYIGLQIGQYYLKILFPMIFKSLLIISIFFSLFYPFVRPTYINMITLAFLEFGFFLLPILFFGFDQIERSYFKKLLPLTGTN